MVFTSGRAIRVRASVQSRVKDYNNIPKESVGPTVQVTLGVELRRRTKHIHLFIPCFLSPRNALFVNDNHGLDL